MAQPRIKTFLDYIPLVILCVLAIRLIFILSTTGYTFTWKNMLALGVIPVIFFAFLKKHQIGVLSLGFILLLGLIGLISFNPGFRSGSASVITPYAERVPLPVAQPMYILWLLIHFILSGRHYVGILTAEYWRGLFDDSEVSSKVG